MEAITPAEEFAQWDSEGFLPAAAQPDMAGPPLQQDQNSSFWDWLSQVSVCFLDVSSTGLGTQEAEAGRSL